MKATPLPVAHCTLQCNRPRTTCTRAHRFALPGGNVSRQGCGCPSQFFGIILILVLRQGTPFETPSDLVVALKEKLTGRVLEKGEEFHVEVLMGVREFWSWLAPIGITLHNAFVSREHIVAPHALS